MENLGWVDLAAPLVLFAMMGVVGLELTVEDFRRVARYPAVVLVGTLAQWTLLPLAVAGLLAATRPEPGVAAGVVLVTAAPGGGISNVFTFLAGANTALSVTLTAVSSLLAVVALPLVTATGFAWFVGEEGGVAVPVVPLIGQLVVLVVLPIALGMELRRRRPRLAERHAARLRGIVLVLLAVLFTAALRADQSGLVSEVFRNLGLALLWTAGAAALGLAVSLALRLSGPDRFTFAIEFSVKNVGLAAIVALAGFDRPDFAVFAGSYVMVAYPLAALCALAYRRLEPWGRRES
jgi:BASS family bile acid:Na+ symporter